LFDVVRLRITSRWRIPLKRWMPVWNRPAVTRAVKAVLSPSRAKEGQVDFRSLRNPTDAAVDRAGWRNTDWRSMRAFRCALDGFDCRADLPTLSVPTIVLHGDRDSLFPVSVAEDLAGRLPHAELRVVPAAGHALPLTHGQHVVRAVRDLVSLGDP
jgi:pimeloyl-ACP methyl ester carboxylesterase